MSIATTVKADAITEAVREKIREKLDEDVQKAVKTFETSLREEVAKIVMRLSDYYSVERLQREIVIRVEYSKETP